jgi:hypothetical protein
MLIVPGETEVAGGPRRRPPIAKAGVSSVLLLGPTTRGALELCSPWALLACLVCT